MYLSRMIYASRKSSHVSTEELGHILRSAEKHNKPNGITGMLCFNRKYFLQVLEGGRTAVNQAYNRIIKDPRHEEIILLDFKPIDRRDFDHWSMGYVPEAGLTAELLVRYGGKPEFNPLDMSPDSVIQMMRELRDSLRTISSKPANSSGTPGKASDERAA